MQDIMTAIIAVFTGLFDLLIGILVPSTGLTPLSTVVWFFLLSPAIMWTVSFVKGLAR